MCSATNESALYQAGLIRGFAAAVRTSARHLPVCVSTTAAIRFAEKSLGPPRNRRPARRREASGHCAALASGDSGGGAKPGNA